MTIPPDIAHIGPVELLTPKPDESLHFFEQILGMEVEHREGQSVYLRGWFDYQPWSLKLTESDTNGLAWFGMRAWNDEALERRVAAIEAAGLGEGWREGERGIGRTYRFRDPDGHAIQLYYEASRYEAPPELRPALKNQPMRYGRRGIGVKRLDHINLLAKDVRPCRQFAVDALTYRLYERIEFADGFEPGAWLSATTAAHELIYTNDARGASGRLHHLAFWVDQRDECLRAADIFLEEGIHIEAAPSKHAIAQGMFLYGIEPGGNRIEVTSGGYTVYDPDQPCVVWNEEERKKGQFWGVKTVDTFHTYGTPQLDDPVPGQH